MAFLKICVCLASLFALYSQAGTLKIDKSEKINGIELQTGKVDSTRTYKGHITKTLNFSIDSVRSSVVNFTDKCNNSYRNKRKYTDKTTNCKYHNDHIVESFAIHNIKAGWVKEPSEVQRYIMGRQVYNRGSFGYYEIIKIYEGVNPQGQKTVTILQKMIDNKEVKKYVSPKFDRESAFDHSQGIFTLTEIGPKQTELSYDYLSSTTHWILNKEVSVPQVFLSISKSINDLVKTVDAESSALARKVASTVR